ncbi:hypothetical protein EJB05_21859, partial [Eragrostis curvula]
MWECIVSDHLTPVLAYRCLVPDEDDVDAPSFLFESVEQGPEKGAAHLGRYSIAGARPAMEVVAREHTVTVTDHETGEVTETVAVDDPMQVPQSIMEEWRTQRIDLADADDQLLPHCFCGGWVGFFSYDTVRYAETKKLPFSSAPRDDRGLPDLHLGLYDDVVVLDHVEKKAYVIHWVNLDRHASAEDAYRDGRSRLNVMLSKLHSSNVPALSPGTVKLHTRQFGAPLNNKSTMTSDEYKDAVVKAKEHIMAGDVFQVVLSQRFERRTHATPFDVYRALRIVNPSPYMAYVQARGCVLVASSPEILTRVSRNGKIINRPLAGTVRRGGTEEEDEARERELLSDEKQRAEHTMLVDLARNDVGKVAKPGSVKVEKLMDVERYSHVMHMSSTVTGQLHDRLQSWDALRAALPVGTVSGAPKVRAMELIDELEVTRRGPYSGGFGGISFDGDMQIALTLRTIVFPTVAPPCRDDDTTTCSSFGEEGDGGRRRREWVNLQAGAGIVADSVPEDEQRECENKAAALARAIDLAESAFVYK